MIILHLPLLWQKKLKKAKPTFPFFRYKNSGNKKPKAQNSNFSLCYALLNPSLEVINRTLNIRCFGGLVLYMQQLPAEVISRGFTRLPSSQMFCQP
jgi:hypothetical protein